MVVRKRIAQAILRLAGWRVVGAAPAEGIVVGAPHTSNWDFALTLLVMWSGGVSPRVLIKQELFRGPAGWVLRRCGGIPIDRRNPSGLVRELVARASSGDPFPLIVAAEGTRKKVDYWKSGFYRIARSAHLPIAMGFIDGPTKTAGFGPTLRPTGDLAADMDVIRAFYADKRGVRPERRTEPRLRGEARPRSTPADDAPAADLDLP
ncbi:MAG TPA: 1-acyl-sn-glycerol-3-phosphate acyltransferase [Kineosporiaceae bacterium]|nr:1-acyl-sn-glycerol-3-phosphate acyltransferase [Kineosporiaceae bacterium]